MVEWTLAYERAIDEINLKMMSRVLAIWLLVIGGLFFPFVFPWILFGLAGSNPTHFVLMGGGFLLYLLSAVIGVWRRKYLYGCCLGALLFCLGAALNSRFWADHNRDLCQKMRADVYCIESETGFQCIEPSTFGNMTTSSRMCRKQPPEELEKTNKTKRLKQLAEAKQRGLSSVEKIPDSAKVTRAIDEFNRIAKTIISSPDPQKLDFEEQLIAIYNCLEEEYENGLRGEVMASNSLRVLLKTPEEKSKYAAYSASKGRFLNLSAVSAALPAGNHAFGCKTFMGR